MLVELLQRADENNWPIVRGKIFGPTRFTYPYDIGLSFGPVFRVGAAGEKFIEDAH